MYLTPYLINGILRVFLQVILLEDNQLVINLKS